MRNENPIINPLVEKVAKGTGRVLKISGNFSVKLQNSAGER
jgi:hypothetical protein